MLDNGLDVAMKTYKQSPLKTILEILRSQQIIIALVGAIASTSMDSNKGLWLLQKDKNTSPTLSRIKSPKPDDVVFIAAFQLIFSCGPCGAFQRHTIFLLWLP